ncbi:metal-sulfur cluster assembly factor [Egicoccus sp. AB-alg6-2]|uniref:metal-sulfur cluster assembly factor n=1 Tax=Egicoccus sp. AB-alg6-2 TaxID=3242692 RepID=UPI00359ED37F
MSQHDSNTAVDHDLDDDVIPEADTPSGRVEEAADEAPRTRHPFEDLPLEEDGMPSAQDLMNGLRAVVDPEIGYNIVDLGLVYEVTKPERGYAHVLMTLTSMGCPLTEVIHQQCSIILGAMPGVDRVEVEFTFTPPWGPEAMADYVREELRAMGMNV